MKKAVLIWFLAANVFCFVTAAVGLSRPWGIDLPTNTDPAHVEDVVLLTQSALGGAAGSYAALEWTDRFAGTGSLHRRIAIYALMAQNLLAYGIALILAAVVDRRRSMSRPARRDSTDYHRTSESPAVHRPAARAWIRETSVFERRPDAQAAAPSTEVGEDTEGRDEEIPARLSDPADDETAMNRTG